MVSVGENEANLKGKDKKLMSYELVSLENCIKICEIIQQTEIEQVIRLDIPSLNLVLNADNLTSTEFNHKYEVDYGAIMNKRILLTNEFDKVLEINNKKYQLFFNIGSWGYDVRIENSHFVLGTKPKLFDSDYFSQIELSQSLEDRNQIYIVKNLTNLAGNGSLMRLNNGAKTKEEKIRRRDELVERLKSDILHYENRDWICIDSINKNDLDDPTYYPRILFKFLKKVLTFAFTIEAIVFECK